MRYRVPFVRNWALHWVSKLTSISKA
jgi:hypothetical protein